MHLFLLMAGGAIGASLRFFTGVIAQKFIGKSNVLTGTVFANLTGCLFGGFLLGFTYDAATANSPEYLFFSVGILGSLSTFSTFILELLVLLNKKTYPQLAAYLFIQLIIAMAVTASGFMAYELLFGSVS